MPYHQCVGHLRPTTNRAHAQRANSITRPGRRKSFVFCLFCCILALKQAFCPLVPHRDPNIAPPLDGVHARRSRGGYRLLAAAAGCVGRVSPPVSVALGCWGEGGGRLHRVERRRVGSDPDQGANRDGAISPVSQVESIIPSTRAWGWYRLELMKPFIVVSKYASIQCAGSHPCK